MHLQPQMMVEFQRKEEKKMKGILRGIIPKPYKLDDGKEGVSKQIAVEVISDSPFPNQEGNDVIKIKANKFDVSTLKVGSTYIFDVKDVNFGGRWSTVLVSANEIKQ